ncbi:MAG: NADPH:quinone oxidoreductase family protein [Paracoccus sp. (in: a-proteobacteria)]|uniref:NADPH:quinone oxidoreductase family protein n=2 Tax=Paracoccus TaxID=265 RepID=UPI000C4E2AB0|nr:MULTISPECIES: NADPH:quinone oxidoreductase family protein [unclassified Paracoccus (in: a-proteobacteria)]MBA48144.1 zinc-binding dehydrogenase [Paracoccus sp. (in: a-proteobacteria)]
MAETIRIAEITALGQVPVLRDAGPPAAGPDEVLVRIGAAALNFADLLKASGQYQEKATPPYVPGLEGAGQVVAAPDGCGLQRGDRVAVLHPGTMAQIVAVPADACLPLPDAMRDEQAAGFQIAYGTSHLALTMRAKLKPGETLAVLGAAGGVGLTAVEIGRAMGARVIGVARGRERLQAVRAAGADLVIDSDDCPDLKAALRDCGGIDVVYDPVGDRPGAAAFGALKRGGRFLAIGFAGGQPPVLALNHALVKNIAIHGFYWGGYASLDPQARRDSMTALLALFEAGRLKPVAGSSLPLERLDEGFEMLRRRKSVGKVVITL